MPLLKMYCGLVDDFAVRNKLGQPVNDIASLNRHLLTSLIFGGDGLIINDGHVLLNEGIRAAILDQKASPFRRLVENHFVQILSRNNGDLGLVAEFMSREGIPTGDAALKASWYTGRFKEELDEWAKDLCNNNQDAFVDWPKIETSYVYRNISTLSLDALSTAVPDLKKACQQFRSEAGDDIKNRTGWEKTAMRLLAEKAIDVKAYVMLMAAANEAYNYTWGAMLEKGGQPLRVQAPGTLSLLSHMAKEVGEAPARARQDIELFIPNELVVDRVVGEGWDALDEFTYANKEVRQQKIEFLDKLEAYYTGQLLVKDMRKAANSYGKCLSRHFGRGDRKAEATAFVIGAVGIGGAFLAPPAGIAIAVVSAAAGAAGATTFARKMLSRIGMPRPKDWIVQRSGTLSEDWYALDQACARTITEGAPEFKPKEEA